MNIDQIMTSNPACCTADETIGKAARLMEQHDCGCIPVVESQQHNSVVGVITDRDIAVRGVSHGFSNDTRVRELMTATPCTCTPNSTVDSVEKLMSDRQIRRVVVVDDAGCCVGIVAQADLARAAERYSDVSEIDLARVVESISSP